MALSLVNANLVWQEVKIAFGGESGAGTGTPKLLQEQFLALKAHLAQVKKNPDLQIVRIQGGSIDDASGQILADTPCKLYGVYLKKAATGTDVFTQIIDDATDDSLAAVTSIVAVLPLTQSSEQVALFYPNGLAMSTGVVAKAYNEFDGVTDSSASDTPDGFIIIGAA